MKILVVGANGFIGHHLLPRLLKKHEVTAVDISFDKTPAHPHLQKLRYDITVGWPHQELVNQSDVVLPLAAIATPATYVSDPLKVFELDFEANLRIVRACAKHRKTLVFPSTSEVYGMCQDDKFDPETSNLVYGPIHKSRWIYACAKQMLDRVIHAYGQQGLEYTLFRPFNWVGPGMDNLKNPTPGASRVLTQFVGAALRNEPITLVDGGSQRRCFTHVLDGIDALEQIIEFPSRGKVYNLGNPNNNLSILDLAKLVKMAVPDSTSPIVITSGSEYYGGGYQDVSTRVPDISAAKADFDWNPQRAVIDAINLILEREKCKS